MQETYAIDVNLFEQISSIAINSHFPLFHQQE